MQNTIHPLGRQNRLVPPPPAAAPTPPPAPARKPLRNPLAPVLAALRVLVDQNTFLAMLQKNLRFAIFLTVMSGLYIWNSHQAEKQAREADRLQKELRELKTEYMTLSAQLSTSRQQSQIARVVDSLGLKPAMQPPFKLSVPQPTH
jgi:cell division protein FtsL